MNVCEREAIAQTTDHSMNKRDAENGHEQEIERESGGEDDSQREVEDENFGGSGVGGGAVPEAWEEAAGGVFVLKFIWNGKFAWWYVRIKVVKERIARGGER